MGNAMNTSALTFRQKGRIILLKRLIELKK